MFCLPMWLASHVRIPWELVRCRTPGLCTQPAWLTRHGGVLSSSLWFGKLCCKRVIMVLGILDAQYTLALQ